jgi:imidazolonepropionase-like amidohydrolase
MHGANALALAAALFAAALRAQDSRPVAFVNARLVVVDEPVVERGTLVVRDGLISALGKDVAAPAGALLVDCKGGSVMPGLVSAFSRAGLQPAQRQQMAAEGPRRGGRRGFVPPVEGPRTAGPGNQAATRIVERLDARQEVFGDLLRAGITTLSLVPLGTGFPGLGALLRPDGRTLETLAQRDDAFVFVGMARESQVKKILKEGFDKAKKIVEERKKPKEQPKPPEPKPEAKPADKPADKPAEQKTGDKPPEPKPEPKPEEKKEAQAPQPPAQPPKPEEKKDPNLEVLADLLEGKRRAIVEIDSAADLLHFVHACGEDLAFPRAIAVARHDPLAGTLDDPDAIDAVAKLKSPLLLPPELSTRPRTRYLTNPAKTLHDAGLEIAFAVGDSKEAARALFFKLMDLVRYGLPADTALAAVTLVPARMLGIDGEVGSLKAGKKANLLVFSGDPLDPTSELRSVWLAGRQVPANQQ